MFLNSITNWTKTYSKHKNNVFHPREPLCFTLQLELGLSFTMMALKFWKTCLALYVLFINIKISRHFCFKYIPICETSYPKNKYFYEHIYYVHQFPSIMDCNWSYFLIFFHYSSLLHAALPKDMNCNWYYIYTFKLHIPQIQKLFHLSAIYFNS